MSTQLSANTRADVEICANPVFIIGAPRSGTSGLAVALGQHTELWTHFESEILGSLFGRRQLDDFINAADRGPLPHWARMHGVGRAEMARYIGLGFNALFTSRKPGKRWIDKTPSYSFIADLLTEMFPGAYFIHIARDGRRVVNSMTNYMRRFSGGQTARLTEGGFAASWTHDFREACRTWRSHVDASMEFAGRHPARCLTVINEELAADPETGFRRIFEFIGAPYERGPVEFFGKYKVNSSFVGDTGASRSEPSAEASIATERAMQSLGGTPEWNSWAEDHAKLFLDGTRYKISDPWNEWSREERAIFAEEGAVSLVKHGLAAEVDVRAWVNAAPAGGAAQTRAEPVVADDPEYLALLSRIREIVSASVPATGPILVVSKGDDRFLRLQGRTVWHFPRTDEGAFTGSHPGTSEEAIEHLAAQRNNGATFLLFPQTAFWWLDYYEAFREHLDAQYERIVADGTCVVYRLSADDPARRAEHAARHAETLRAIIVRARRSLLGLVAEGTDLDVAPLQGDAAELKRLRRTLADLNGSFESFLTRAANAANQSRLNGGARLPFPFDGSRIRSFPDQQPVFVVGAGRSGTTAIANALREGAGYPGWVEGHVYSMLPRLILTMRELRDTAVEENGTISALGVGHLDDYDVLNDVIETYHQVCAEQALEHGLARWVDKTPGPRALTAVPILKLVYPNARFVFMHRHPVNRALSWLRYVTFPFKSPEAAMTSWLLTMTAWQAVKRCLPARDYVELAQSSLSLQSAQTAQQVGALLQLQGDQIDGVRTYLENARPEATVVPDDARAIFLDDVDWPDVVKEWCEQTTSTTAQAWGYRLKRADEA